MQHHNASYRATHSELCSSGLLWQLGPDGLRYTAHRSDADPPVSRCASPARKQTTQEFLLASTADGQLSEQGGRGRGQSHLRGQPVGWDSSPECRLTRAVAGGASAAMTQSHPSAGAGGLLLVRDGPEACCSVPSSAAGDAAFSMGALSGCD